MSLIHGTPLSSPSLLGPAGETRFWYWYGASGRRYIHSVYDADACPPLPGAIYIAVKCIGEMRTALRVGRFPTFCLSVGVKECGADEIHVHLLARNEEEAAAIFADLQGTLGASRGAERAPEFFERPIANSQLPQMVERRDHVVAAGA